MAAGAAEVLPPGAQGAGMLLQALPVGDGNSNHTEPRGGGGDDGDSMLLEGWQGPQRTTVGRLAGGNAERSGGWLRSAPQRTCCHSPHFRLCYTLQMSAQALLMPMSQEPQAIAKPGQAPAPNSVQCQRQSLKQWQLLAGTVEEAGLRSWLQPASPLGAPKGHAREDWGLPVRRESLPWALEADSGATPPA